MFWRSPSLSIYPCEVCLLPYGFIHLHVLQFASFMWRDGHLSAPYPLTQLYCRLILGFGRSSAINLCTLFWICPATPQPLLPAFFYSLCQKQIQERRRRFVWTHVMPKRKQWFIRFIIFRVSIPSWFFSKRPLSDSGWQWIPHFQAHPNDANCKRVTGAWGAIDGDLWRWTQGLAAEFPSRPWRNQKFWLSEGAHNLKSLFEIMTYDDYAFIKHWIWDDLGSFSEKPMCCWKKFWFEVKVRAFIGVQNKKLPFWRCHSVGVSYVKISRDYPIQSLAICYTCDVFF